MATYRGEHEQDFATFLDIMRHKMASSKFRGQRRFETDSLEDLEKRFVDEIIEFRDELHKPTISWFNVALEAADVANFAMFFALRAIKMMGGDPRTEDEKRAPMQQTYGSGGSGGSTAGDAVYTAGSMDQFKPGETLTYTVEDIGQSTKWPGHANKRWDAVYGALAPDLKQRVTMQDFTRIAKLVDEFDKRTRQTAFDPTEALRKIMPPEGYAKLPDGQQCTQTMPKGRCTKQWTDGSGHYWCCGTPTFPV